VVPRQGETLRRLVVRVPARGSQLVANRSW